MPVISKALGLAFIQSGISLPSLPGHRTSLHFGWYSFPIPLREKAELAWLAWWNTEVVYLPKDGRGGGESNSRPLSRKSDTLTRRQSHYFTGNTVVHNLLFNFAAQLQIEKLEKNCKNILELMQGPQYYLTLYLVQFIQLSFI